MNEVRLAHHVRPLHADSRLERAARAHSSEMLRSGAVFHGAVGARVRSFGVRAPRIGENLAWAMGRLAQARTIVKMWMASPSTGGTCSIRASESWASARCEARSAAAPAR